MVASNKTITEMTLNELQELKLNLTVDMMEIDAQLAVRNDQPWKGQAIAAKFSKNAKLQKVKYQIGLTASQNIDWKEKCLDLVDALEEIEEETEGWTANAIRGLAVEALKEYRDA